MIPFASGRKGIHIASRSLLSPRDDWYAVFSHMTLNHWSYEFPTLDGGIYQNRALIRAPFSRHPKSAFARKKPIPWEMFWRGSFKDIQAWAQDPLTDMQWAEMECLVSECLPINGKMLAYWIPFAEGLVLDFRRHKLTKSAIKEAKPIVVRRRFRNDWAALLDETGLEYRERKTRLDGTGSLIVPAGGGAAPMYPSNRNAFYRDRDTFFNEIQLPSENLTFELVSGAKATIKVWGNAQAAKAWLSFLVSDEIKPSKRFTMEDLVGNTRFR